jgi:hypothetical protein
MLRYSGVIVQVMRARGSSCCTAAQTASSRRPAAASFAASKSRSRKCSVQPEFAPPTCCR